jgi:hypothetical protein
VNRHRLIRRLAVLPAALSLVAMLAAPAAADDGIICLYVNDFWIACI